MAKHLKLILLFIVVSVSGIFLTVFIHTYKNGDTGSKTVFVPLSVSAQEDETTWPSPDGKETLNLKKETSGSTTTYSFQTQKGAFYTMTIPGSSLVSIPFNTWSPDNKYFYIKKDTEFLAVNPNGEATSVNEKFQAKYTDFVIADVTGWAANTLLVINTNKVDGSKGPSIWFDVATGQFTQLSSRFD